MKQLNTTGKVKIAVLIGTFIMNLLAANEKMIQDDSISLPIAIPLLFLFGFIVHFVKLRMQPVERWELNHWNENPFTSEGLIARYTIFSYFSIATGAGLMLGLFFRAGRLWSFSVLCCIFGLGMLSGVIAAKYLSARKSA